MKKSFNYFLKAQALVFNRWSRKSFGVFNSIHRVVNIGVLTGTLSLLSAPVKTFAQPDTIKINKHLDIDEVVVSANRTQKMYSEVSRMMTIIPASEIQGSAAQSVNELLKVLPGVDIKQRGGQGVQSDISLRGGSFEQTLILINGIPVNDPQTGHHNLNLPIDIENIERIEILYGPNARVYGPNAFTGAINIITNSGNGNGINALLSGGQYGLYSLSTAAQLQTGKVNHYLALGTKSSDGYQPNTDFKTYNIFYHATTTIKPGTFSLQAGYLNKAFGAQDFYTLAYPEQFEQIRQASLALGYKKSLNHLSISSHAYWKQNHDRFELFREDTYAYQGGYFIANSNDTAKYYPGIYESWNYYRNHNYHLTNTVGLNMNLEYQSTLGRSAVGLDARYEEIFSNVLGTVIDSMKAPGETGGYFTKSANRQYLNIFAEHSKTLGKLDAIAGLLYHYNNQYGHRVNGGLEISYALAGPLRLFGSLNQAMRMPTFTDLYYDGPNNIGNPDLKPESAITYELGLKRLSGPFQWQAAAYFRQTTNAIDWIKYPSETQYTTTNFSELNTYGLDAALRFSPKNNKGKIAFLKSFTASYSFNNTALSQQDSSISAYALDYLKHKITASTDIQLFHNTGLRIDLSWQSRHGDFEDINKNRIAYEPYLLLDTRLYYQFKHGSVFVDANNLLDKKYIDLGGIPEAGLWIKGGIKFTISKS